MAGGGLVRGIAWRLLFGTLYTTGLTLLLPSIFLPIFPGELEVVAPGASPALAWSATVMLLVSLVGSLWYTHSVGAALKALGRLTFIPGFIGLVLLMFGREAVLLYLARTLPRFEQVKGLLELYIDSAVPRVRYLTVGFFASGAALLLAGTRLEAYARARAARHRQ